MEKNKKRSFLVVPKYSEIPYPNGLVFEDDRGDIVYYGYENEFPQYVIELYNKSSTNNTCINAKRDGIYGDGLTCDNEMILKYANKSGESWNDIFYKLATDKALFGGYALEIIWSNDRTKVAEVYHIDFSWVRAHKMDYRGNVPGYYISYEFANRGRMRINKEDLHYLPTFNKIDRSSGSQLYFKHEYQPGMRYYPLPGYMGGLNVIGLDAEVDMWHLNNIRNGLAPSLSITTFMDGDAEQIEMVERMLRENYGGSANAGSLLYMDVANREQMPEITPIPQNGADGYYTMVNDMVVQKILTAHRITSPMLLGIKTEGQLGGRAEMLDAYSHFQTTVIRPMQQEILSTIEEIMKLNGYLEPIMVKQVKLFDDGEEEIDIVTSDEQAVGEDIIEENKIERETNNITNGTI
jgi:hypothetical protein